MGTLTRYSIMNNFINFVISLLFPLASSDGVWLNLECETGHKYLFSSNAMTWSESVAECALYGGWLLDINSIQEQNCIVRNIRNHGTTTWYFHDGNDLENEGVYRHKRHGAEMAYVHWNWRDTEEQTIIPRGDNYDVLAIGGFTDHRSGAWKDFPTT